MGVEPVVHHSFVRRHAAVSRLVTAVATVVAVVVTPSSPLVTPPRVAVVIYLSMIYLSIYLSILAFALSTAFAVPTGV